MAIQNTFYLDVDIKRDNYVDEPKVTQNDAVTFVLRMTDDGVDYPLAGVSTYTLASLRPDNQSVLTVGSLTGVNEITFELGSTEVSVPGNVKAAIQLYDVDGRVSSIPFTYEVTKDIATGYIPSKEEKTLIELVLGQGPAILTAAQAATITANDAAANADAKAALASAEAQEANSAGIYARDKGLLAEQKAALADASANEADTATYNAENATQEARDATNAINAILPNVEGLENRGEYNSATTYVKNNLVERNGSSWQALQDTVGNQPPTLPTKSNAYWTLISQRGVDGMGAVSTVNGEGPDVNGNVVITIPDPDLSGLATKAELQTLDDEVVSYLSDYVNVKSFGALGDGISDDTEAFANAFTFQQANGGILVIPNGVYIINRGFMLLNKIDILGIGFPTIKASNTFNTDTLGIFRMDGDGSSIKGVKINGNNANLSNSNFGLVFYKAENINIEQVECINTTGIGIGISNCRNIIVKDCKVEYAGNNGTGFWVDADLGGDYLNANVTFDNCTSQYNELDGFIVNVDNVKLLNCTANNNGIGNITGGPLGAGGIYSDRVLTNVIIENCACNNNTEYGINVGIIQGRVIGTTCNSNALSGINIGLGSQRVIISNCITSGNGTSDTTGNPTIWGKSGIQLDGVLMCIINSCSSFNNKDYGICHMSTTPSTGLIITSNNFKYNGKDDANIGSGYPTQAINGLVFTNNY